MFTLCSNEIFRLKWLFSQLGGKDPAYVRPDADIDYTAAELVDGTLSR